MARSLGNGSHLWSLLGSTVSVKPDDDENLKLIKKVDDRVQKLIKEGKKVELKKVELPTRNSVTAYYTIDGVEHVETFR